MKNQITELKNIIQVLCNSIVKDEEVKKQCLEIMSQMNDKSAKRNELKLKDEKDKGSGKREKSITQSSNGKRKELKKKEETIKIINHSNKTNDDSGDVNNVIRNQYRQKKEDEKEDQQILGD